MTQTNQDSTLDILTIVDEMESSLLTDRIRQEFSNDVRVHTASKNFDNDLKNFSNQDIDLILVDKEYAHKNVFDALKMIRRHRADAEVIFLSSDMDNSINEKVKEAGAYDYIYKDRGAIDKVIYTIREFRSKKFLRRENRELKGTAKKSNTAAIVISIIAAVAIAALIYFLS